MAMSRILQSVRSSAFICFGKQGGNNQYGEPALELSDVIPSPIRNIPIVAVV